MEQNRKPKNNIHIYGQIIFDKGAKVGKDSQFLQQMVLEKTISTCKRRKLDLCLTSYKNINSKCIKMLNVRPKTIKLLEENTQTNLHGIGFGSDFLNMILKAQTTKAKIYKRNYIKLKNSAQHRKQSPMFTAALFTVAKRWKQPKCPLIDEWIKEMWYIYTMEYYSAIKRRKSCQM